jgi:hypothetical protein
VTDKAIVELAQHCHMLKSLLLRACDRLSGVSIKALARHCQAIETLDLSGTLPARLYDSVPRTNKSSMIYVR